MSAFFVLLGKIKLHHGTIVLAVLYSALNKIFDILPELCIGVAIDVILNPKTSMVSRLGIKDQLIQLYFIVSLTVVFWLLEAWFEYVYTIEWKRWAQNLVHEVRMKTFTSIQSQDISFFRKHATGDILNVLNDDINQLEIFLSKGPNEYIQIIMNVLLIGSVFLYLSPFLTILTLLPAPFVFIIARYYHGKMGGLHIKIHDVANQMLNNIAYKLQGIVTIKSYTTVSYEVDVLEKESNQYKKFQNTVIKFYAEYVPVIRLIIMVGFITAMFLGGLYALQGKIGLNWYPTLMTLTQKFLWPFTTFTTVLEMYEKAGLSCERIVYFIDRQPNEKEGSQVLDVAAVQGTIEFKHVAFAYNEQKQVFKDMNFTIPAHKTVAFVGTTGSGKSTIVSLLLRFYDVNSGVIVIDGHDITDLTLQSLRAGIGLVSQDVYMVQGTIADNICYGTFHATKEQIVHAAQMAQAHDFIMSLPEQYDTVVEEYGKNFSGGQRQRISIARALLKNAPILIFDEATSAVDNETEAALQKSLQELQGKHTIIMIAHRLMTVRGADTIYVLDKGNIVEFGTHDELLAKNGIYAHLYGLSCEQ